jgi:N-acyl-D-aspartate/D-glutamate deacylase
MWKGLAVFVFFAVLAVAGARPAAQEPFDVIVANGRVIDGSGNPWFRADIGIRDGRITAIGKLEDSPAKQRIDAKDQIVSPGFIDMMTGDSIILVLDRASAASKLLEGVTTTLVGEGDSPAPQNEEMIRKFQETNHSTFKWTNYAEYFDLLTQQRIALNVVHNVGAAQIREVVLGNHDVEPNAAQLQQMERMVAEAMQQGSVGVSTALIYPPGSYAKTPELIALAKVAAQYGGVYFSHMRNESGDLLGAIQEAIQIGEEAHIPVHIYHLKAAGQENWPLIPKALALIRQARDRGIDVTADAYPYIYNGIDLASFIGPWHFASGRETFVKTLADPAVRASLRKEIETKADWENWYLHVGKDWGNVLVAEVPPGVDPKYAGMSVAQIAKARNVDDWTAFFDLVEKGNTSVNPKSMNEEQKREIYQQDFVSISSDAPPTNPATSPRTHPRAFGTFPRILAKYVRDEHAISLPDAIREMTSLPADQLKINDRGRIAPGMAADLVIFDPATVKDTATYANPTSYPVGIEYVLVNGKVEVENGKVTGELAGQVIRHHP